MSSTIDERIVEMTFKGAQFATGVQGSVDSLTSLKNGLNDLKGSEQAINNIDAAGRKFSLRGIASGVSTIASRFTNLGIVGVTAINQIANQAVLAGERMLKSLTIDPIKAGLDVYETKINAIQTILANTQSEGTNLKQVTGALDQLNKYANLTVYNFGEMAHNIGTFTAAGVNLKTSVASIKGIANLAALSGSSAEQASGAMYQLSQAIASGTVHLQDWNSVTNAGLGGKVFQNALVQTARATGVNIDAIIKKAGSFRQSLQSGWLTSKILTQTLSTFTGDLSAKQLKAMGYTAQETKAILKQGKTALQSATQVRTITQLMQALKEEVATAWASIFEAIIGNSKDATATLSSLHNIAESALTKPIYNLAALLKEFDHLGGRDLIIQTISEAFHYLGMVLHVVGQAFHEVFPPSGGGAAQGLIKIAIALQFFVASLQPSAKTLSELKTIFIGLFSAVKIVIDVIGALIGGIGKITSSVGGASGGLLSFVASIAQLITNVRKAIESGTALQTFFRVLGSIIAVPIKFIGVLLSALSGIPNGMKSVTNSIAPFFQIIRNVFSKITDAIGQGITSGNFQKLATLMNTLLGGSILLVIRNFLKNLGKSTGESKKGLFSTIKESFDSLTKTLVVMQSALKSDILKKIAISVALLAASLVVLSFIKPQNLAKALAAMTVMFLELGVALKAVLTIGASAGIVKMVAIGLALNLLSTAIVILTGAVAILAQFSWTQLAKGLSAIAILLGELVVTVALLSKDTAGLIGTAIAMNLMAGAINLMSIAVGHLGKMNISTLAKGIGSIAILLSILAGFNAISGVQLIGTATAMVILGAALNVIASAVGKLGSLSVATLAKGLISIAVALGIIAGAMALMGGPSLVITATGLLLVATSLVIMSNALTTMGGMSWGEIAKSLVELAGALVILAAGMYLMSGAIFGAAALVVVAGALAVLTPVLIALGAMSWGSIVKGLAALAGVFVILGAAGLILSPVVLTLLGLGAAITLIGVGILAAGAGVLAFSIGLTGLAVAVTASGAAILSFVTSILDLLPLAGQKLGETLISLATAIGSGGVALTAAFVALTTAILNGIIKMAPLAGKAFDAVLQQMISVTNKNAPRIINTFLNLIQTLLDSINGHERQFINSGISIIVSLLNGISANMRRIVNAGTNVIISFINAIGSNIQRVVSAGVDMVINLVNGIADKIRNSSPRIRTAASNLGSAIIEGLVSAIGGGLSGVVSAAVNVASSALSSVKRALGINSPSKEFAKIGEFSMAGWAQGTTDNSVVVTDSVKRVGDAALGTLAKTMASVGSVIGDNLDLQPRITPVVDLTQAKSGFGKLSSLAKKQIISATASTITAASISANNSSAFSETGISPGGTNLTFNQYNTSPQALSAADIYRRTKNQLSVAKGALAGNANSS